MKKRFGVLYTGEAFRKLILFDKCEAAEAKAKKIADGLSKDESAMLVIARCDDKGRLVSATFEILNVWCFHSENADE